jgi:hypothetical protein
MTTKSKLTQENLESVIADFSRLTGNSQIEFNPYLILQSLHMGTSYSVETNYVKDEKIYPIRLRIFPKMICGISIGFSLHTELDDSQSLPSRFEGRDIAPTINHELKQLGYSVPLGE